MDYLNINIKLISHKVRPTAEDFKDNTTCLLLNPCDGFHVAYASICPEDGEFLGFTGWASRCVFEPGSFYVAWAVLPEECDLSKHFPKNNISYEE